MKLVKSTFPNIRMRRRRQNPAIRNLLCETKLTVDDLIQPLFIKEGLTSKREIASMPGQHQLGIDDLHTTVERLRSVGIKAVMLFGIPKEQSKDADGSCAWDDNGIVQQSIKEIKRVNSDMLVITDLCFCEYTNHGHCGVICNEELNNDATLINLQKQAVSLVKAGADIIAPSGMIDGMVQAIRSALDEVSAVGNVNGVDRVDGRNIPIMSYAVKYASAFYGPFRDAAEGTPQFGDRKTYQMDPANSDEAILEAALDIQEGADMLMVKPAISYLDIIYKVKQLYPYLPMVAYQVSGEYSMIKCAAEHGLINEQDVMHESLLAIKRAGTDLIISYFAEDMARLLA